jgi:hypothetical protein
MLFKKFRGGKEKKKTAYCPLAAPLLVKRRLKKGLNSYFYNPPFVLLEGMDLLRGV